MKRFLCGLILVLALVLTIGTTSMAAPLSIGETGTFFVFGEYGGIEGEGFTIGGGYTFADGIAAGAEILMVEGVTVFGVFADMSFGSVLATADVLSAEGNILAFVSGLYMFDLDQVKVGVGGSALIAGGGVDFAVKGAASYALSDNFSVYGGLDYYIDAAYLVFKAGVSYGF